MFNNSYDNNQDVTNDYSAEGQQLHGMEQFSLPSYDAWRPSIDFMLWPPGSCEYGSHVGSCPNISADACTEQKAEEIPRSPWESSILSHCFMPTSGAMSGTTRAQSYCSPRAYCDPTASRQAGSRGANVPADIHMSQQASSVRPKNIPLTTPVWKPGGPTQRYSNSL